VGLKGFAVAILIIGELPMLQLDWCVKSCVFGAMISYVAVIQRLSCVFGAMISYVKSCVAVSLNLKKFWI